jgi:hypothetical protein
MLDEYLEPESRHKDDNIKVCALRPHHATSVLRRELLHKMEFCGKLHSGAVFILGERKKLKAIFIHFQLSTFL